ncbi:unnamed protein product [Nesidiocoris tenuis]|uniref:Uncharacterized protein n=1 Tax=Nesidiocoris tenuis TaxID=355587 RepID=A0A6H5HJJ2_9HEMI|nr:unnamed protein product [Nesidiocoris tenuis]
MSPPGQKRATGIPRYFPHRVTGPVIERRFSIRQQLAINLGSQPVRCSKRSTHTRYQRVQRSVQPELTIAEIVRWQVTRRKSPILPTPIPTLGLYPSHLRTGPMLIRLSRVSFPSPNPNGLILDPHLRHRPGIFRNAESTAAFNIAFYFLLDWAENQQKSPHRQLWHRQSGIDAGFCCACRIFRLRGVKLNFSDTKPTKRGDTIFRAWRRSELKYAQMLAIGIDRVKATAILWIACTHPDVQTGVRQNGDGAKRRRCRTLYFHICCRALMLYHNNSRQNVTIETRIMDITPQKSDSGHYVGGIWLVFRSSAAVIGLIKGQIHNPYLDEIVSHVNVS